ncbi:tripartite tricarboxylate transporter substrate binding protein [Marinobacterium lutimaris]|uniref:Tripartite-type tricarboxylate transporter, receptor component TctC n=1 Tax=Marinobacterium lutimaris TaxID=568106 RepID=A0A1H6AUS3_9GAMM|nr:tripartite tricarboxylate transporter substrate binding protein [Marinobacterium lutimaris]SEG51817.1 Tripartite-type tricarboxylate transporter, receptor component TctC [Marinobacterium lutimaris]
MKKAITASVLLASALTSGMALAEYPTKPITMVIPYNAGGGTDVLARALQPALEKSLGQTIIVNNIPGGGGILGFTKVATAKADGYTVTIPNNVIFATEGMGNATYKSTGFDYLGNVLTEDYVVAVRADGPWQTWDELVEDMKANPGKIKFGFSGYGGSTHVASAILARNIGYEVKQIPHDGSSKAVVAAMGGHIDALMLNLGDLASGLESGKLRPLLSLGEKRMEEYPDVPTLKEEGGELLLTNWRGVAAPAGVSDEVKEAWGEALKAATSDPAFVKAIAAQGATIDYVAPGEELDQRMQGLAKEFIETAQELKQ